MAAYIASIGSAEASSSAVNRSEPPCPSASGATIRYAEPQPVDQVGPALPRVGEPVQDEQDRLGGVAVLVHEQPPDSSL